MNAKVLFTSVRLLLGLIVLTGLAQAGPSPVQASANALTGTIAYVVGNQPDGDEIHLIEPDGSGDRVLFRTNNPLPENFADIISLAWKPDASELAFASGHEYLCSLYNMDIYAIRANGEDYRRVTDPPACGARAGLPTGTVIVPVFNANTYSGPFFIYFEGAPGAQAISLASGSTKMVTFENVADYGDVEQSAVYITKDGRYTYAGAHLNVIPGETLTTNTVNMATGVEHFGWYWPSYLHDGSKISTIFTGHDVFTFESNNREPGFHGDEKLNFKFLMSGTELTWGPTPELANKFLYWGDWQDSQYNMHGSIFLGDITDGSKEMLVDADPNQDGNILLGYSWLPDGSGFLYSHKQMIINWEPNFSLYEVSNIWEYSFATGESKRITNVPQYTWIHQLSVSPDGSKIVYEYQPTGDWINRTPLELWIMNRDGSDQHRLVSNGRNPAWSPAAIPDMKPVPALNSISPVSATGGGAGFTLTATGSSFVQGTVVRWNGADLATTYGNATTLTAQVPADKIATAGTANVTVFNPGPGGGTSLAKTFTIHPAVNNNPVPTATNLDPAVVDAGAPAFPLTVSGTSFISNSVVRWNGASLPTTFVNATTLTAQVTADKIAQTGPVSVTVFTPAPGGGESNALTLSIVNPAPVLSGLNPGMATAGGPSFTLTVSGSKFVNGSVVTWNGIDLTTTYVSAARLTAQVPANKISATGKANVTVYNPAPGGGTSSTSVFTVSLQSHAIFLPLVIH